MSATSNFQQLANFIWSVADLLRGPYHPLHATAPIALFRACNQAGIRRVVQISQDTAPSQHSVALRQRPGECVLQMDGGPQRLRRAHRRHQSARRPSRLDLHTTPTVIFQPISGL
jgi:hypothetical protein